MKPGLCFCRALAVSLVLPIYLKRCANYMVNGVPSDWTGVEMLMEK